MKGFAFGFDDFGFGHGGFVPDADTATKLITHATEFLTLARTDLTYATGNVAVSSQVSWVPGATELLAGSTLLLDGTRTLGQVRFDGGSLTVEHGTVTMAGPISHRSTLRSAAQPQ